MTSASALAILSSASGGEEPPRFDAEVAQLVEHLLAKEEVAGSNPVFRSINPGGFPGFTFCDSGRRVPSVERLLQHQIGEFCGMASLAFLARDTR